MEETKTICQVFTYLICYREPIILNANSYIGEHRIY